MENIYKNIFIKDNMPPNYEIDDLTNIVILISNPTYDWNIKVKPNARTRIFLIYLSGYDNKTQNKAKIKIDCCENSHLEFRLANLSKRNLEDTYIVNLNGKNANLDYYSACFLNNDTINRTNIQINHIYEETFSKIKAYYVLKNKSDGFIRCSSNLIKGAARSVASQELRLVVLDPLAKANSDPVLLINENDIVASHANAIGMLDQDIIFYMESRGLHKLDAEKLIVKGYFLPIIMELEEYGFEISKDIEKKLLEMI
ncbi:SufD family Fe-S cluster assembly protein [Spiroplasma endosymbiont of Aspidapion aeneum]|uniref:SufB/SufD family protein n=1 Tax=Spiroplasma endosymbiont of Aspidapion aeneum TaxID=3066276 RepID=UPI00313F2749